MGSAHAGTEVAAVAGKGAGAPGPLENLRSPAGLTLTPVMAANNKQQLFKPVTVQAAFVLTKRHAWLLQSWRTRWCRRMKIRKDLSPDGRRHPGWGSRRKG